MKFIRNILFKCTLLFDNCTVAADLFDNCPVAADLFDNCPVAADLFDNCPVTADLFDNCPVTADLFDNCPVAADLFDNCPVAADLLYPQTTKLLGGIGFTPSVRSSVRPSVCPACRVRSVTSTVLDGFFPYYPQMITTMRGCVAHNDLWPWPISSRSFGLDLENHVRSVVSTVLDGFFLLSLPASVCVCVCLCVNHLLVRAITRDPLKLGSPICFGGQLTLTFKVKFNFQVRIHPILRLSGP